MTSECLDECDDLILWFSEGTYVYQAMELKMKYKPLTPLQQEKYDHRNDGIGRKDSSKRKPSFRKSKERPGHWLWKIRKINTVCDMYIFADLVCNSWIRCRTFFGFSEGRFSLGRILTADTIISMISAN